MIDNEDNQGKRRFARGSLAPAPGQLRAAAAEDADATDDDDWISAHAVHSWVRRRQT